MAVFQTDTNYVPITGDPFTKRHQQMFSLAKESGGWKIFRSRSWMIEGIYDKFEDESTSVVVRYTQDPKISNIPVIVGQETQVPIWVLESAP